MSVCAMVKTRKRVVDLKQIMISLARTYGYGIVCKHIDEDCCQFYLNEISTRPIDITKEKGGWEVRLTSLATEDDYILYARSIKALIDVTGGKVEDEEGDIVDNPLDFYGKEWRDYHMEADANSLVAMSYHKREDGRFSEIELYGVNCEFCVGIRLMEDLGITIETDWRIASKALITRFQYSQYGRGRDIKRTTTNMQVQTAEGKKSLTFYTKNGYDMISYAEYIVLASSIEDMGHGVMLRYDDFIKIAPQEWERFDNCQYYTTKLSDEEFNALIARAQPHNLMGKTL